MIAIAAGEAGVPQPVHIHSGSCSDPGGVDWPLESIVDGASTTVLDASLSDVRSAARAINVHKSGDEIATYTACGELSSEEAVAAAGGAGPAPAGVTLASDIAGFALQDLTIAVGTTVTWTNRDNAPHTVSHGTSPAVAEAAVFRSGTLTNERVFSHTFDALGTFAYFCEIHPDGITTITVEG